MYTICTGMIHAVDSVTQVDVFSVQRDKTLYEWVVGVFDTEPVIEDTSLVLHQNMTLELLILCCRCKYESGWGI